MGKDICKNNIKKIQIIENNNDILGFKTNKDIIDITSAFILPVLITYIAFQQWSTSEKRRKQDLFDKRYKLLYLFNECSDVAFTTHLFLKGIANNNLNEKSLISMAKKLKLHEYIWNKEKFIEGGFNINQTILSYKLAKLENELILLGAYVDNYLNIKKISEKLNTIQQIYKNTSKNKLIELSKIFEELSNEINILKTEYIDSTSLEDTRPLSEKYKTVLYHILYTPIDIIYCIFSNIIFLFIIGFHRIFFTKSRIKNFLKDRKKDIDLYMKSHTNKENS